MTVPRVTTQLIAVETPCPQCGVLEVIGVNLMPVLTIASSDGPSALKVKCMTKPIEHWCNPHIDQVQALFARDDLTEDQQ